MDAIKGKNKHSGSAERRINERKKSTDGRSGRKSEEIDEDDCEDNEDYFQTLVTRGPARGVLTVHVKTCTDFKSMSVKMGTHGFLRITVGGKVKCTRFQPYKDTKVDTDKIGMYFNEWKYFSIQIPKEGQKSAHELVVMELIFFEPDTGNPKLIGKTSVRLQDCLNKERMTMHVDLKLSRQVICKLDLDMVVTYGSFGYGYSHQVKHPKRSKESFVDRSLFLRCPPSEERKDSHYNVVTPRPVPHWDIIGSLIKRESQSDHRDSSSTPTPTLMDMLQRRGRLLQLHETFDAYENQSDMLPDLEKLIFKRGLQTANSWRQLKSKKFLNKWKHKATLIPRLMGFAPQKQADLPAPQPSVTQESSEKIPNLRAAVLAAVRKAKPLLSSPDQSDEPGPPTSPRPPLSDLSPWKRLTTQAVLSSNNNPSPQTPPEERGMSMKTDGGKEAQRRREEEQEEEVVKGLNTLSLSPEEGPSPAADSKGPFESWLRAPSSIPSLSRVLSEKDLEPIRSSLAFMPSSPQPISSTSSKGQPHAPKPGRDKLKNEGGTSAPYQRRPSASK